MELGPIQTELKSEDEVTLERAIGELRRMNISCNENDIPQAVKLLAAKDLFKQAQKLGHFLDQTFAEMLLGHDVKVANLQGKLAGANALREHNISQIEGINLGLPKLTLLDRCSAYSGDRETKRLVQDAIGGERYTELYDRVQAMFGRTKKMSTFVLHGFTPKQLELIRETLRSINPNLNKALLSLITNSGISAVVKK